VSEFQWSEALSDEDLEGLYMSFDDFKEISEGADLLTNLSSAETSFLFQASLEHGAYMDLWFARATSFDDRESLWQIIEEKITDEKARFEQAENAITLLGQIREKRAIDCLKDALQQDALAPYSVRALAGMKTNDALGILSEALQQDRLADLVVDNMGQLKTAEAVNLLSLALRRESVTHQAELSLERISKSRSHPSAIQALNILNQWRQSRLETAGPSGVFEPATPVQDGGRLRERDWELITRRIRDGKCTPIIGPDASYGLSFSDLARKWARERDYPLRDDTDFCSVAEFVSLDTGRDFLEGLVQRAYEDMPAKDSDRRGSLAILAELPLPVYITTGYDDALFRALRERNRDPRQEVCRWNRSLRDLPSVFDEGFRPTPSNPLVFHLYGRIGVANSLVLTVNDYLDFLINTSKDESSLIPSRVQADLTGSSNLYLGFRFPQLSSRVFFRLVSSFLERSLTRTHVAVMRLPEYGTETEEQKAKLLKYLDAYFEQSAIRTYWGSVQEFSAELRDRWEHTSDAR
jgi:hypothetical protein